MNSRKLVLNDSNRSMHNFLIALTIFASAGLQSWRSLFNNFASETLGADGFWVGLIQSVREVPGFLALLVIFLLRLMPEHRLSSLSILVLGLGLIFTGYSSSLFLLLAATLVMSTGFHYYETTCKSQVLQYFDKPSASLMLAKLKSITALSNIAIGGAIWVLLQLMGLSMQMVYIIMGIVITAGGIISFTKNPVDKNLPAQKKKMVFKKKYWLFYLLNFFSGSRRQIFVVFAVFLLVVKYKFSVETIVVLFVVNNVINYFVAPLIGRMINSIGERKVLSIEYTSLIFVFLGYAFIDSAAVAAVLYVIDHIFFNFSIGINTYFQKTADTTDIAPSMAVSFTINHIAAVFIPLAGGMLWTWQPSLPFIAGAFLSFVSLLFVQKIRTPEMEQMAQKKHA